MINIFYDEIIKEASLGRVYTYYKDNIDNIPYNIVFNTVIEEDNINYTYKKENNNLFIPTLVIRNKLLFNTLLEKYLILSLEFYSNDNYIENENKIKKILTLLWSNATYEDFNEPINFLRKRIDFFNNNLDDYQEEKYINFIEWDSTIGLKTTKASILNETPYKFQITLYNGEYKFNLPIIYYGISNNTVYIYAIQNNKDFNKENNKYQKYIKRKLYSLNEGLDIKKENYDNYDIGNIKDISNSFLLAVALFINVLENKFIDKIVVSTFLPTRYNSKEIMLDLFKEKLNDKVNSIRDDNNKIQSNLTEKFVRLFLRLSYHYDGINVSNYPNEVSNDLVLSLNNTNKINNSILKSLHDEFNNKNKKI